jgi:hypothetical protein
MNVVVIRALACLVFLACSSGKRADGPKLPVPPVALKATTDVTIAITDQVTINGVALSGRPMVKDVVAVLGKPNRTWDEGGANKVHTWDKLGVVIYEPYDGRCISATFPFKPMEHSFTPATLFGGKLLLDGNALHARLTLDVVKKWRGATFPYGTGSSVFDRGDVHVFTQSEDGAAGALDLVEISFWQRGDGDASDLGGANEQACRNGDGRVCVRVALAYQMGHGVEQDAANVFVFAKLGCDANTGFACTMLGNAHAAGVGTPKNPGAAKLAWDKACKLGDPGGCARVKPR